MDSKTTVKPVMPLAWRKIVVFQVVLDPENQATPKAMYSKIAISMQLINT